MASSSDSSSSDSSSDSSSGSSDEEKATSSSGSDDSSDSESSDDDSSDDDTADVSTTTVVTLRVPHPMALRRNTSKDAEVWEADLRRLATDDARLGTVDWSCMGVGAGDAEVERLAVALGGNTACRRVDLRMCRQVTDASMGVLRAAVGRSGVVEVDLSGSGVGQAEVAAMREALRRSAAARSESDDDVDPPDCKGYLTKQGGLCANWLNRWFELRGDELHYFAIRGDDASRKGVISMCTVSSVRKSTAETARGYELELVTPSRTFRLCAKTAEDFAMWLGKLGAEPEAAGELASPWASPGRLNKGCGHITPWRCHILRLARVP